MEKFLKIYGIILLSLLSVALAGLLIAGIVFMAPSLSDISSDGGINGLGNGIGYVLGVLAFVMCVEILALAIPFFFQVRTGKKEKICGSKDYRRVYGRLLFRRNRRGHYMEHCG